MVAPVALDMLRPSLEDYHESKFIDLTDGIATDLRNNRFARALNLYRPIFQEGPGKWVLRADLVYVPDCLMTYIAEHKEVPVYYVR